jgi:20S proteasome subunit beta 1
MAAAYNGGVILGADSRTSTGAHQIWLRFCRLLPTRAESLLLLQSGNYVANRATNKITQLTNQVYMCRSGSAADTQAIASYVQLYAAQFEVRVIVCLLQNCGLK